MSYELDEKLQGCLSCACIYILCHHRERFIDTLHRKCGGETPEWSQQTCMGVRENVWQCWQHVSGGHYFEFSQASHVPLNQSLRTNFRHICIRRTYIAFYIPAAQTFSPRKFYKWYIMNIRVYAGIYTHTHSDVHTCTLWLAHSFSWMNSCVYDSLAHTRRLICKHFVRHLARRYHAMYVVVY